MSPSQLQQKCFDGAIFVGANVSETVTSCVAETALPALSVTCHVTAVIPNGNETGALFEGIPTEQLSVVEAVPTSTVQFDVKISGGRIKIGSSSSITVII